METRKTGGGGGLVGGGGGGGWGGGGGGGGKHGCVGFWRVGSGGSWKGGGGVFVVGGGGFWGGGGGVFHKKKASSAGAIEKGKADQDLLIIFPFLLIGEGNAPCPLEEGKEKGRGSATVKKRRKKKKINLPRSFSTSGEERNRVTLEENIIGVTPTPMVRPKKTH